jgi:chromosome segregation ATPase
MSNILNMELEKLERELSAASAKIESLNIHIQNSERDIALAKGIEKQLTQNLSMLKDSSVIASASEYKKVKADLKYMAKRVDDLMIDLKNSKIFLDRAKKLLIELNDKYAMISESQKSKVLTGNFGNR